ncbi:hypothetical protein NHQ30_003348 [Ciborinia camelliae]|nr:hypothetical protein NHQ30_003348 [Ciborinia camelliae]
MTGSTSTTISRIRLWPTQRPNPADHRGGKVKFFAFFLEQGLRNLMFVDTAQRRVCEAISHEVEPLNVVMFVATLVLRSLIVALNSSILLTSIHKYAVV